MFSSIRSCSACSESLKRKQTRFCYFDTHAGRGRYDLRGEEATRTREYAGGVQRLLGSTRLPAVLHVYVNLVRALNAGQGSELAVYPGSPLLASLVLREHDHAILCELQEDEAAALKALFRGDARFAVHQRDGYEALKALTPPKQKRGLVLIDPPFEAQVGEFLQIEGALAAALDALAECDLCGLVSDQAAPARRAVPSLARRAQQRQRRRARRRAAAASGQFGAAPQRLRHGDRESAVAIRPPARRDTAGPSRIACAKPLWRSAAGMAQAGLSAVHRGVNATARPRRNAPSVARDARAA